MDIRILAALALIQGLTEFLPVSSSAHLILFPKLTGAADQGVAIDVAVHVGTLFAVVLYFWRDVFSTIVGGLHLLRGKRQSQEARLAFLLVVATIPVILFGALLKLTGWSDALRDIRVIGWTMIVFGVALYWADMTRPTERRAETWSLRDAIVMGLWQALAIIPGTSRSGATITAARILGFTRSDGARLAMLMSIPTIIASGVLVGADLDLSERPGILNDMAIGAGLSFFAALLALVLMMRLLRSVSFTPYVIYRVLLGLILLWIGYGAA